MKNSNSQFFHSGPLAFGGAAISGEGGGYGFGEISELEALDLLSYAYDQGIKVFDSAPIYGFGLSEIRLGKAFKGMREKVQIVSKSGIDWHENKRVNLTNEPQVAIKMLHQSLERLQTDYIDFYLIHWPDPRVDIRKPLEVLKREQEKGRIKHLGLCNTHAHDLIKAQEVAKIDVIQGELSLVAEESLELIKHPLFLEKEFMAWGPLCKGILSLKAISGRQYDKFDARSWAPWWKKMPHIYLQEVQKLIQETTQKYQVSALDLALAYFFDHPQVTSILVGMKTRDQIDSAKKAVENRNQNGAFIPELLEKIHKLRVQFL